ncbi:MAG: hypothetical protein IIA17_07225 [candidate division Zixibacteria bacterium]|nr:hypothetical protein [candidate division Zixibacteria bacterium]
MPEIIANYDKKRFLSVIDSEFSKSSFGHRATVVIYNPSLSSLSNSPILHRQPVTSTPFYWSKRLLQDYLYMKFEPCLHLNQLRSKKYILAFDKGLSIEVGLELLDKSFTAFNEKFGIYGHGDTESEALSDFNQSFIEFYDIIVDTPDNELGKSAIEYKHILKSFATLTKRD